MMRTLIFVAFLALPIAAQAQTAPAVFTVPTPAFQHVVQFLQVGGTHAEGQALAEQLIALAQQQINAAAAQAAQAAAQKPPETPAK